MPFRQSPLCFEPDSVWWKISLGLLMHARICLGHPPQVEIEEEDSGASSSGVSFDLSQIPSRMSLSKTPAVARPPRLVQNKAPVFVHTFIPPSIHDSIPEMCQLAFEHLRRWSGPIVSEEMASMLLFLSEVHGNVFFRGLRIDLSRYGSFFLCFLVCSFALQSLLALSVGKIHELVLLLLHGGSGGGGGLVYLHVASCDLLLPCGWGGGRGLVCFSCGFWWHGLLCLNLNRITGQVLFRAHFWLLILEMNMSYSVVLMVF